MTYCESCGSDPCVLTDGMPPLVPIPQTSGDDSIRAADADFDRYNG